MPYKPVDGETSAESGAPSAGNWRTRKGICKGSPVEAGSEHQIGMSNFV